ncbi:MAG TPA: hypothetical protein VF794_11050 [Archangium sp.]|jgi:hypothetical protein|uniref:hypothetical protein n=1 Tax=Archangium sp. TaxID=1872627 RepID=UPI002ED8408A
MTLRQPLLSAALALGLLAGCSKNATPNQPAESGGTPPAQMEAPVNDKPVQGEAVKPTEELPSGGTAAAAPGAPAERGPAVFFVKHSGVRCMAAPCPTYSVSRPDRPNDEPLPVTDVDLSALNVSEEKRAGLLEATMHAGIKVEATVDTVPNAGPAGAATVLRVTRLVQ